MYLLARNKENHEDPTYSTACLWSDKDAGCPDDELRVARKPHHGFRCPGGVGYLTTLCQDMVFTALSSLGVLYSKGYMGKVVSIRTMKAYRARTIAPVVLDLGTRWMQVIIFTPRAP